MTRSCKSFATRWTASSLLASNTGSGVGLPIICDTPETDTWRCHLARGRIAEREYGIEPARQKRLAAYRVAWNRSRQPT
jgi:hypothetical protein